MEPCELDVENIVFPKKFKYKILKKRKIDSQNFECELRIALNDYDDVKEWFKHFKGNTNTEWLLRQSTTCEENVLNQLYVCQNSSFGKKRKYDDDEGSKLDFNCKAAISVKIKKGGKRTYYQDEYVKRGYKGLMRICFIHTHLIDKTEVLNMARQTEETKKAFIGYFTEGMSPSEAIRNHEEILLLEGHEDLGNSRKNPSEEWVYDLYEEWTKEIENRLQLESQLTRASVFWRLQNRSTQPPKNSKSKNIVKLCKLAEDINGMQIPADLHVSDNEDDDDEEEEEEEEDDSDSENQYDSYDEDSSPQVSSSYMSVTTNSHQTTTSCVPLKLNVSNNINITRGCTLQVIKNNSGGNKSNNGGRIIVEALGNNTNSSQGNSMQIITTSHENNKKPVFKVLTVTANSRKCTNLELGKTFRIVNTPKVNRRSVKNDVSINSKECQNVSKSLPKSENATKINSIPFIKNTDEDNLKTSTNMKPVFVRVQKGIDEEETSSLVKHHESQKDAETVMQHILTKCKNSVYKNDNISYESKQTFQGNKVACPRSDIHDENIKPVLKNCVQNFTHSPRSENVSNTNIVKNVQNQGIKNNSNCPKPVPRNVSNNTQQAPVKRVITVTRYSVLSHSGNPSVNKKRDKNDLKNIDEQKDNKNIQFPDSEMLFQNREQQFENFEKINNINQITLKSTNDSFDNCPINSLVPKHYFDVAQSCSPSSLESLPQVLHESGSVQSITNPISSVAQGLGSSKPILYDNVDSLPNLPKHDAVVTSSSSFCHADLLSDVHHENAFQNSNYLEILPIKGSPFPLPENLDCTLAVEKDSYMGSQGGGDSQMFPLPLSKDLYDCVETNNVQIPENQNESDDSNHSMMLSETFCNSRDSPYIAENSGNHSISGNLSYSLHDPDFNDICKDINSSQLLGELNISNEESLQKIFPDLRKLENELNNFSLEFPTVPNPQQMDLCSNQNSVGNHLSLLKTCTNSLPELQVNPLSLFENYEDNILPLPENLKGNIEDIDILKNILKCNKLENTKLEEFFQQPENYNRKEILEKWDSQMHRLRSLLEQNVHDGRLMKEANQFLERIKESIVTPSELAIFFSSACNLKSQEKKY